MTADPPRAKKHHYNPRHHLARFADGDGRLWVYDRRTTPDGNPYKTSPEGAGFEKWLYAPEDGTTQHHDDTLETWLAQNIDGPGATAIDTLIAGGRPTASDREAIARYLAAQDLRTPSAREWILKAAQGKATNKAANFGDMRDRLVSHFARKGFVLTEGQFDKWTAEFTSGQRTIPITKKFWLEYLQTRIPIMAPGILALTWRVVHAPTGVELILPDSVIIKGDPGFMQTRPYKPGWTVGTEWVFPLTPTDALWLGQSVPPEGDGPPNRSWFERVHERAAEQARFAVVSRSPQSWIAVAMAQPNASASGT